jgi:hypothetical protein
MSPKQERRILKYVIKLTNIEVRGAYGDHDDDPWMVGQGFVYLPDADIRLPFTTTIAFVGEGEPNEDGTYEFGHQQYRVIPVGRFRLTQLDNWNDIRRDILSKMTELMAPLYEAAVDSEDRFWQYCRENDVVALDLGHCHKNSCEWLAEHGTVRYWIKHYRIDNDGLRSFRWGWSDERVVPTPATPF